MAVQCTNTCANDDYQAHTKADCVLVITDKQQALGNVMTGNVTTVITKDK